MMLLTVIVLIIVIILIMILMMKIMMMIIVKSDSKIVRTRVLELDSFYLVSTEYLIDRYHVIHLSILAFFLLESALVLPNVSCVYLGNITDGDLIMIYTKYHYQGCQMNLRLLST